MTNNMIYVDGNFGEGGGQVLRTSLGLSMITSQPFTITNIRAGRKKKGLLRQHLTAVKAAAEVCNAQVEGDFIESGELTFIPGDVVAGNYRFEVGTAGSATLVLQTILPALMRLNADSTIVLKGGTHNPYAPPFDFLQKSFFSVLRKMGVSVKGSLKKHGFYPAGGGKFLVEIAPCKRLLPLHIEKTGKFIAKKAVAVSSQIPEKIGIKEIDLVSEKLSLPKTACVAKNVDSAGPGNVVLLEAGCDEITEIITGFGQKGLSLKKVVANVVRQYRYYQRAEVSVGLYLADQLLIPMALAGEGSFTTVKPTLHTITNIEIIKKFLNISIDVEQLNEHKWKINVGE